MVETRTLFRRELTVKQERVYRVTPSREKPLLFDDNEDFLNQVFGSAPDLGTESEVSSTCLSSLSVSPTSSLGAGRREKVASLPTVTTEDDLVSFLRVAAANDSAPAGHWKRGFETARQLRNHPKLCPFRNDHYGAFDLVEAAAPGWIVETFGSEENFFDKWDAVRKDLDDDRDPLVDSYRAAQENPITFPGRLTRLSRVLGSIAAYQSLRSKRFQLPQPQLAEMIGSEQRTISAAIRRNLIPLGIVRESGVEGRKKFYTYHGPQPVLLEEPIPQADPPGAPSALENRQRTWVNPPAVERSIPKGSDPYLALPEADGRDWYLTADYYADLQSRYPSANVYQEIERLRYKLRDYPESRPNDMRRYIEGWMKRAKSVDPGSLRITSRPGEPRDGEKDGNGKLWSAFNRCWTPEEGWIQKGKLSAVFDLFLLQVYDE